MGAPEGFNPENQDSQDELWGLLELRKSIDRKLGKPSPAETKILAS